MGTRPVGSFPFALVIAIFFAFVLVPQSIIPSAQGYHSTGVDEPSAVNGGHTLYDVQQSVEAVVVRHAPVISGRVEGSVRQLKGENVALNSGSVITSDLLVPGTPSVRIIGKPSFGGVVSGTGNS